MIVSYHAPEIAHPNSDNLTVVELARILESKYHLLEIFTEQNKEEIVKFIVNNFNDFGERDMNKINGHIQYLWREFIIGNGSHIITKAAQDRGDPSFIHTSAYYLGISVQLILEEEDVSTIFEV